MRRAAHRCVHGELIATPALASQVGFAALWLSVVSCVIKVVVQEELGHYTILVVPRFEKGAS